jgi:hypothetical protein
MGSFFNLFSHSIVFIPDWPKSNKQLVLEPSGKIAQCIEIAHPEGTAMVNGVLIPIFWKRFSRTNLPPPDGDSYYLVPEEVAQALWREDRQDIFYPDSPIYKKNKLIGYRSLCRP